MSGDVKSKSAVDVLADPQHPIWGVMQNLTLCGICVCPFFLTASNLSDLSELKAALPGIVAASVWNKIVKRKKHNVSRINLDSNRC